MIQRLINWPLILVLLLKRYILRWALALAQEETKDAKVLVCDICCHTAVGCRSPARCAVQRFKDRERLLENELVILDRRIAVFSRA